MNKARRWAIAWVLVGILPALAQAGDITLKYLGAFRAGEVSYGGFALAYYPDGNGGQGSLYTYRSGGGGGMYEFDVPELLAWSRQDPSVLPRASVLQGPVSGVSPHGLEYLPADDPDPGKLYFGRNAQGSTHGYMDLDFVDVQGPWPLAGVDNRRVGHYVFEIPESWRANVDGKSLVTGYGWAQYGKGPDLYAYDPVPDGGSLPAAKLLEYNSSHTMTGWDSDDVWEAGAWVEAGEEAAVLIGGRKYIDGVGRAQILFYDPDDFVAVLGGGNTYDPQPWKYISVEDKMFSDAGCLIGMAYDRAGGVLYASERIDSYWGVVVHAWEVTDALEAPHPGDANDDDKVDWEDYTIWCDNAGLVGVAGFADGGWSVGNFNNDDVVDEDDYAVWEANYGYDGGSVPEPTSLLVLGAGGALLLAAGRRRRRIGGSARVPALLIGVALLAAGGAGSARADEYDWATPMRYVHAEYQDHAVPAMEGTIAQFGDSITVTQAYFQPLRYDHTNVAPADQTKLDWLQSYIHQPCWDWYGSAYGSEGGTTVSWGLENMDGWLATLNPEVALIMWGTNDLYLGPTPPRYTDYLRLIVLKCKENGTVPILFTIPPKSPLLSNSDTEPWVTAIRQVAAEQRVPLVDFHQEIITRRPHDPPNDTWDGHDPMWSGYSGYEVPTLMACDGIHPSNWSPGRRNFDETEGLNKNGYTLRNYLTLQMLYDVYEEVLAPPAPPPLPPVGQITCQFAYLGSGRYGLTLTVNGNDFMAESFGVDVSITPSDGGQIDTAASAFLEPFVSNALVMTETPELYHIEAGTGPGSQYEQVDLAYVVTDGDLAVSGVVARDGQNHLVSEAFSLPLPGDANLDGRVDGADYTLWADNYQSSGAGWGGGDFNGDNSTNGADYTIWADNYTGASNSAVPEPAALSLLALGSLVLIRRRRA